MGQWCVVEMELDSFLYSMPLGVLMQLENCGYCDKKSRK